MLTCTTPKVSVLPLKYVTDDGKDSDKKHRYAASAVSKMAAGDTTDTV